MTKRVESDVHQTITDAIVAAIEAGAGEFTLPWQRSGLPILLPRNAASDEHYNGVNILTLWASAEKRAYPHGLWASYRQWAALGAQVRGGKKGTVIVFYKRFDVDACPDDEHDDGKRVVAKHSHVFNVAQVDGYAVLPQSPDREPIARHQAAQRFIEATGAEVRIGGERAYYSPSGDYIQMPAEALFRNTDPASRTADFTSVHLHELGHWSGAPKRLNREFGKRFGDDAYAVEELVAELTSAFLCAELGVSSVLRPDHVHYIDHWLKVMKADKKAIFTAAAKAGEAVRYLRTFSAKLEVADAA